MAVALVLITTEITRKTTLSCPMNIPFKFQRMNVYSEYIFNLKDVSQVEMPPSELWQSYTFNLEQLTTNNTEDQCPCEI